jgi:hypothetical protein
MRPLYFPAVAAVAEDSPEAAAAHGGNNLHPAEDSGRMGFAVVVVVVESWSWTGVAASTSAISLFVQIGDFVFIAFLMALTLLGNVIFCFIN